MGMAFDSAGNLLVADSANDRIRKIDSSGIVTTVAGGYLGDGGPAALSSLNLGHSSHSAFDSAGNLYIADSQSFRVRRVSTGGTITTFAGNGTTGYSGDGGPATEATFGEPEAVAADNNGNIFISDDSDEVIRKVDNTGTITTFSKPIVPLIGAGLATDKNNNLYVADGFWAIWRITPDGSASVVAGTPNRSPGYNGDGGPAVNASLNAPTGIAVDAAGNLYIADSGNERVRKVYTNGIISTLAGTGAIGFSGDGGPATAATLFQPADVAVDAKGNVYVVDQRNARIRVINSLGTIQTLAGTGNTGYNGNGLPATQTNLSPTGIAVGPKGFVYFVSDDRVRKIH
jgi:sugar lactone lactonase YvrE